MDSKVSCGRIIAFILLLSLGLVSSGQARAGTSGGTCGGPIRHEVSPGETPGGIAKQLYGHSGSGWWHIVTKAAGITDPRKLRAYSVLMLPDPCGAQAFVQRSEPSHRSLTRYSAGELDYSTIRNYVVAQATALGVDPRMAEFIIRHESNYCATGARGGRFKPAIQGDDGKSIGCWQIHLSAHPDVSRRCAENFYCSTSWAIREMAAGNENWWTTWRFRRTLYPKDPIGY